jgi:hypothetical protein
VRSVRPGLVFDGVTVQGLPARIALQDEDEGGRQAGAFARAFASARGTPAYPATSAAVGCGNAGVPRRAAVKPLTAAPRTEVPTKAPDVVAEPLTLPRAETSAGLGWPNRGGDAGHALSVAVRGSAPLGTYSHVVPELAEDAARRMGEALWG